MTQQTPIATGHDLQGQVKATANKVIPAVVSIASTVMVRDQSFSDDRCGAHGHGQLMMRAGFGISSVGARCARPATAREDFHAERGRAQRAPTLRTPDINWESL